MSEWRCLLIVVAVVAALYLATDAKAGEYAPKPQWKTYKGTGAEEIRNRRLDYWSDKYIESTQPKNRRRGLAIDRVPQNWENSDYEW